MKSITIEKTYTINLGNFESLKVGVSVVADVGPNDDPDFIYEDNMKWIEDKLHSEISKDKV